MRFLSGSIVFLSALALLPGCSKSNNSSSSTSNIDGWVGAQGFNNGQVVVNQIAESGQVSVDTNGIYLGLRESTDTLSRFTATVANDEVLLFVARGQIADVDKDRDNLATQRQCQLMSGCSGVAFADFYPASKGFEWRSVAYTVSDGSRNNVNAITTLASAFAYQSDVKYGYDNHQDHADDTGGIGQFFNNEVFTAYDVVLANSQTAKLFGVEDIIGDLPANLTKLNNFNQNTESVRNQIRYGALLAAFQELELAYLETNSIVGNNGFATLVAEQFARDQGQLFIHSPVDARILTLQQLYQSAHDNLVAITAGISNTQAKAAATAVIDKLANDLEAATDAAANTKTAAVADDLSQLLTASEVEDFNLGIEKTKLFVADLLNYQQTFWQAGYKSELDEYLLLLKSIGDEHRGNLDALTTEFANIQDYYVTCIIGAVCTDFADLEARKTGFDSVTKILTLDSGKVVVSQKIADVNTLDNIDEPTSSHAMDVYITGTLEKDNLVLILAHDLDSAEESIDVPSAMRIYYNQEVTGVRPDLEIQGYELIWGEFQLYDKSKVGVDFNPASPELGSETELSGAFRIFYRGVKDPQDSSNPLRFNIEDLVLSSRISDQVDDDAGDDREFTSLVITAKSSNPDAFYPAEKLAKFDGFFTVNDSNVIGSEIDSLLEYIIGKESVPFGSSAIEVQTIDFISSVNDDIRYRFYPTEQVVDEDDSDRDGDVKELVDLHRIEECKLNSAGAVESCGPKTKVYDKVDMQKTINEFWELGVFQRQLIDGRGIYFVDFDTKTDDQNCLVLETLSNDKGVMKGTLIEQQVLGLDSVRLFTEVQIENASLVDLPKTLFDATVVAPTKDKYRISAAISHNYSGTTTDNTGLVLGTGGSASSLLVSYDTSADFENAGNLSIAKGGVSLTLDDGAVVSEDQDITAFLSQSYDPASVDYKIIEDAEGLPNRCVSPAYDPVGNPYVKDPSVVDQVFYLNYRDVIYGTARPEGPSNIWTIRYIDGTWMIPAESPAVSETGI